MCGFCKGNLKQSTTEYMEKLDNHVVLITDVPCDKCEQCGEVFFSTNAIKTIEHIMEGIQRISSVISLTVIDFKNNAA